MKGCIYARESSGDTNKAPDIQGQIDIGKKSFLEHNHELIETYQDNDKSGGDWQRTDFEELKRDAKTGLWDFVWVWAQDRLARETEMFRNFYRTMKDSNIKIYVGTQFEEIQMETVGNMAKHTVTALADEMFRMSTSEKVKATYRHRKKIAEETKTLLKWGRNPVPLEIKEQAFKLKEQNPDWGCRKIAAALPAYPLKLRPGEITPRMGKVSYGWVHLLFKPDVSSV